MFLNLVLNPVELTINENKLQETQTLLDESQELLEPSKQEQDLSNLSMEQLKELQATGKLSNSEEIHANTRTK